MTAGSALWGQLAAMLGLPAAYFIAAVARILGIALTWRCKLPSGAGVDLAPSMQWPAPVLAIDADADSGPAFYRRVPHRSETGAVGSRATIPSRCLGSIFLKERTDVWLNASNDVKPRMFTPRQVEITTPMLVPFTTDDAYRNKTIAGPVS
jgi:Transmembrane secretion effector